MLVSPRWVYRAKMLGRAVWSHASEGPVLFLAVALGVGLSGYTDGRRRWERDSAAGQVTPLISVFGGLRF